MFTENTSKPSMHSQEKNVEMMWTFSTYTQTFPKIKEIWHVGVKIATLHVYVEYYMHSV